MTSRYPEYCLPMLVFVSIYRILFLHTMNKASYYKRIIKTEIMRKKAKQGDIYLALILRKIKRILNYSIKWI